MCDKGVASTHTTVVCGIHGRRATGPPFEASNTVCVGTSSVCALYGVFFTHLIQCVWVLVVSVCSVCFDTRDTVCVGTMSVLCVVCFLHTRYSVRVGTMSVLCMV